MLNYIKSEIYRVTHSKSFYFMTAVLAAVPVFLNLALLAGRQLDPNFRYGTFRFMLNCFTAQPFIMIILGAVIASTMFSDDRKCGVLKTTISYGISRDSILIGKCIVSALTALFELAVVLAVYVGTSYIMQSNPEWLPLREMLTAIAATLPAALASMVLAALLVTLLRKEMTAVIWWAILFYVIPMVCFFIGLKVDLIERIGKWMPYNFLNNEVMVTYGSYSCLWDRADGFAKCIIAGITGIIVFLIFGIVRFRKHEL